MPRCRWGCGVGWGGAALPGGGGETSRRGGETRLPSAPAATISRPVGETAPGRGAKEGERRPPGLLWAAGRAAAALVAAALAALAAAAPGGGACRADCGAALRLRPWRRRRGHLSRDEGPGPQPGSSLHSPPAAQAPQPRPKPPGRRTRHRQCGAFSLPRSTLPRGTLPRSTLPSDPVPRAHLSVGSRAHLAARRSAARRVTGRSSREAAVRLGPGED